MRRFKLIGNSFPQHLKNTIVEVDRIIKTNTNTNIRLEYRIVKQNSILAVIPGWEVEEVLIFNEYLKLIKQ